MLCSRRAVCLSVLNEATATIQGVELEFIDERRRHGSLPLLPVWLEALVNNTIAVQDPYRKP